MPDELVEEVFIDCHIPLLILEILLWASILLHLLNEGFYIVRNQCKHHAPKELFLRELLFFAMWIGEILEYIGSIGGHSVITVLDCQLSPRGHLLGTDIFQLQHLLPLGKNVLDVLQSAILEAGH